MDEQDRSIGRMEKMQAHVEGKLHRAFSVFIFNSRGEMLLQQRATEKYHSGGLWTNACCSHPGPDEDTAVAALRRLQEELGFVTPVEKLFDFVYRAEFGNGLTEYEFDHVFTGFYDGEIRFNPQEVKAVAWRRLDEIRHAILENPEEYTPWFRLAFPKLEAWHADRPDLETQ